MLKILKHEKIVANKEERCMLCHEIINIGELYCRQELNNGECDYVYKSHVKCIKVASELASQNLADEIDNDNLSDGIADYIFTELTMKQRVDIVYREIFNQQNKGDS